MRYLLRTLLLLAVLGVPQQAGATPPRAPLPRFERGACRFKIPRGLKVTCGFLTVSEDRTRPDGPTIQLAVTVVRARGSAPAPDPVVYLSGGPGSAALRSAMTLAQGWAYFLANRDLIVFDQRGTGFSKPSLTCPESEQLGAELRNKQLNPAEQIEAQVGALLRCRDRLALGGVNLAAYNSAASAADLDDLRRALGYAQWNMFGISYGTRLALTAMRDHPEGIRSVMLDSVYPPQSNLYIEMPANIDRSFRALFDGCAASPQCSAKYPSLEAAFYELVDRLNATPISIQVIDPRTRKPMSMLVDGDELIGLLFRMLYVTSSIPQLPKMIADTRAGDYRLLAQLETRKLERASGSSAGMYFSVQCAEEIPFGTAEETAAAVAAYPHLQHFFAGTIEQTDAVFPFCAAWNGVVPEPSENQPVSSAIPTLLLSGEYDPITPPSWARQAAASLAHSYAYTFPGAGHAVVSSSGCPSQIMRAFLNNPAHAPDSSCIAALGAPAFR